VNIGIYIYSEENKFEFFKFQAFGDKVWLMPDYVIIINSYSPENFEIRKIKFPSALTI
jgi:hypothetical protein